MKRGEVPWANTLKLDMCPDCRSIHIDLFDSEGRPFATAGLPPEAWQGFIAEFCSLANGAGSGNEVSIENDPLVEVITSAIRQHSSPTVGRGSIHGGQTGYIVYELDGLPFIVARIIEAVRGLKT